MSCRDAIRALRVERMGRIDFEAMLAVQERRHKEVVSGDADDTLYLLEHHPIITLGKNSSTDHILCSDAVLQSVGIARQSTSRGGDVTYHGPGQLVGYPILKLQDRERDVRAYVYGLEEIMIRTARDFGVEANRVEGAHGVWIGNDKLGAIGVRLSRWTTMHGFSFNVSPDLSAFELIIPCGLQGKGVTSLGKLMNRVPTMAQVEERIVFHALDVFDRSAE